MDKALEPAANLALLALAHAFHLFRQIVPVDLVVGTCAQLLGLTHKPGIEIPLIKIV